MYSPILGVKLSLDLVKSIPEFEYEFWQQSAVNAYEICSDAHYKAVTIIRNKNRKKAISNTIKRIPNFDAIITRLDCAYADKTTLLVLQQGLEMEMEKQLILVTNKIV